MDARMRATETFGALLAFAALAGDAGAWTAGASRDGGGAPRRDNVVLVILDDVGIDALGLYAGVNSHRADLAERRPDAYPRTPHLDALAAQGVLFTQARVNPICSSTRASILTGRYAFRHGIGNLVMPVRSSELESATLAEFGVGPGREEVTLAHVARAAGYETLIAGKYHLALRTEERALGGGPGSGARHVRDVAGFDHHWIVWKNLPKEPPPEPFVDADGRSWPPGYYNFEALRDGEPEQRRGEYATDVVVEEALRLVRAAVEPWFLVLAFNAPHAPFDWPPPERVATATYLEAARAPASDWPAYNAMLEALDANLGTFLAGLAAEGQREHTWVFVIGDNGTWSHVLEHAVEHDGLPVGKTTTALVQDAQPRFKHSVFEGGVRVPLIASGPGITSPGRRLDALVDGVDLFATLAEVFGVDPAELEAGKRRDSVSFYPLLAAADETQRLGARHSSYVERFEPNGDPRTMTFEPQAGGPYCSWQRALLLDGTDGRFKLVEGRDSQGRGWQFLFQLADAAGQPVDPFELAPLETESRAGRERWKRLTQELARLLDS